jgi:RimJ/RimL family protein N-acetyltransferase
MAGPFSIKTSRLELIAGNHEMAVAEMNNILSLSEILQAEFTYGWPPPDNNEKTMEWFFNQIYDNPHHRGWLIWYFIQIQNGKRYVIGNGGFTGPPNAQGEVECGYSILSPLHGNGFATEAIGGLVNWAFAHKQITRVLARTKPGNAASIKVLQNNGFVETGYDHKNGLIIFVVGRK